MNVSEENNSLTKNDIYRRILDVSDASGVTFEFVVFIREVINFELRSNQELNAQSITKAILKASLDLNGPLKGIFIKNGINSSEDIGTVVMGLCEQGLLQAEVGDKLSDFDGIFETENLEEYLKSGKIKKGSDLYMTIMYGLCGIGVLLFVMAKSTEYTNESYILATVLLISGLIGIQFENKFRTKSKMTPQENRT